MRMATSLATACWLKWHGGWPAACEQATSSFDLAATSLSHLVANVAGLSEIQPVIERIDAALARPIALPEGEVTLSVSVGVSEASAEHHSPEDLLRDADRAMYASKRLPR